MWKRMMHPTLLTATLISMAVTFPVCWLLVFKAGWVFHGEWFGGNQLKGNDGFPMFYAVTNMVIATLGTPFLSERMRSEGKG